MKYKSLLRFECVTVLIERSCTVHLHSQQQWRPEETEFSKLEDDLKYRLIVFLVFPAMGTGL